MIVVARESRGMTQGELAEAAEITQGTLSKMEHGKAQVSAEVLIKIAGALKLSERFFSQDFKPRNLPVSFFRKRARVSGKKVRQIQANLNVCSLHARLLLASVNVPELNIPILDPAELQSVESVASEIRMRWGIHPGPVENLIGHLEDAGILVIRSNFGTRQVDAISRFSQEDQLPPIIFINCSLPGDRQRFSVAHELGHIILHHHLSVPHEGMEEEADRFASELLMPASQISYQLKGISSLRDVASLKPTWKVSMAALIERAARLGKITPGRRKYLWTMLSREGYRQNEPYPLQPEEPSLIKEIIESHLDDLEYTWDQLSDLLGPEPDELRALYEVQGRVAHLQLVGRG